MDMSEKEFHIWANLGLKNMQAITGTLPETIKVLDELSERYGVFIGAWSHGRMVRSVTKDWESYAIGAGYTADNVRLTRVA